MGEVLEVARAERVQERDGKDRGGGDFHDARGQAAMPSSPVADAEDGQRDGRLKQFRADLPRWYAGGAHPQVEIRKGKEAAREYERRAETVQATVTVGMPLVRLLSRRHIEIALAYLAWLRAARLAQLRASLCGLRHHAVEPAHRAEFRVDPSVRRRISAVVVYCAGAGRRARARLRLAACRPRSRRPSSSAAAMQLRQSLLLSPRLRFDPALATRGSLLLLMAVAVASTAVVAASYVAMLVAFGILPAADFGACGSALLGRRRDRRHGAHTVSARAHDAPPPDACPPGRPWPCLILVARRCLDRVRLRRRVPLPALLSVLPAGDLDGGSVRA